MELLICITFLITSALTQDSQWAIAGSICLLAFNVGEITRKGMHK